MASYSIASQAGWGPGCVARDGERYKVLRDTCQHDTTSVVREYVLLGPLLCTASDELQLALVTSSASRACVCVCVSTHHDLYVAHCPVLP